MDDLKTTLNGANDQEKLKDLTTFTHKQQGIWFLNAFWGEHSDAAEDVWSYVHRFGEYDLVKKDQGNELDELNAHRFLESIHSTMTVKELRDKLREAKCMAPNERPKGIPLTHFLMVKYRVNWSELVNRPQGGNQKELREAQRRLDEVTENFKISEEKAQLARQAEAPFKAAHLELQAALAEVKAQEDALQAKKDDLTNKSQNGSTVQKSKAANELAQLNAEDPLPLRKARITLAAAEKRAEKARAPFLAATQAAEEALAIAQKSLEEAQEYLEKVKAMPGQPYGALFWIERSLTEQKKYLPLSRGGTAKK